MVAADSPTGRAGAGVKTLGRRQGRIAQRPVLGGDNDSEAIEVAIENAALNGVAPLCRFVVSTGLGAPELAGRAPYDLIVANILAGPLVELSESFAAATRPGGRVLLSGLLVEQADMIVSAYTQRGFALERHIDLETGGAAWRTLVLRKP